MSRKLAVLIAAGMLCLGCGARTQPVQPEWKRVRVSVSDKELVEFAHRWKQARTVYEKRAIALEVVDCGGLYHGSPLATIEKVFGSDWDVYEKDASGGGYGFVNFGEPSSSIWYLYVAFEDRAGATIGNPC